MDREQYEFLKEVWKKENRGVTRDDIYFLNGAEQNRLFPNTYQIPTKKEKS